MSQSNWCEEWKAYAAARDRSPEEQRDLERTCAVRWNDWVDACLQIMEEEDIRRPDGKPAVGPGLFVYCHDTKIAFMQRHGKRILERAEKNILARLARRIKENVHAMED